MSDFVDKRVEQIKEHFLDPKRWARRLISSTFLLGVVSIILGVVSVIGGRDVDFVDHVINSIFQHIPILRRLASSKGRTFVIENSQGDIQTLKYLGDGKVEPVSGGPVAGSFQIKGGPRVSIRQDQQGNSHVQNPSKLESFLEGHQKNVEDVSSGNHSIPIPDLNFGAVGKLLAGGVWVNYAAGQFMDRVLVPAEIDPEFPVVDQTVAYLGCIGQGPACYRQWQMNNTRSPDAESVGETFKVNIEDFGVGRGDSLSVGKDPVEEQVPVSFRLLNSRNGLEGINAYDVQYKVQIIDSEHGPDNPYCETGWRDIKGSDLDGDGSKNDLYPGSPAGSGYEKLESINIGKCQMMQPGLGQYRTVSLQVRYDYSSLGKVDFEVMSDQVYRNNPSIQISEADAEALNTPAQAAVRVMSDPVLFNEQLESETPFTFNAQVESNSQNSRFKVRSLEIEKPSSAEVASDSTCDFEVSEGNMMELKPEERQDLVPTAEGEEKYGKKYYWFEDESPLFGCNLQLTDLESFSETGETLSMTTRTNYTVIVEEKRESFEVYNEACEQAGITCPMLVTQSFNESSKYNWKTKCEGVDSGTGCSVIKGSSYGTMPQPIHESLLSSGENAIDPAGFDWPEKTVKNSKYTGETGEMAIGLTDRELARIRTDYGWAVTTFDGGTLNMGLGPNECNLDQLASLEKSEVVAMMPYPKCYS